MPREIPMDREAADRIERAVERDHESPTAPTGFDERATAAADRNKQDQQTQDLEG